MNGATTRGGSGIDHVLRHRGAPYRVVEARTLFDTAAERVSDHPGVLVRHEPAEPAAVTRTRVVTSVDVGLGHTLSIRGDQPPLSWDRGLPLVYVEGEWRWLTTELATPFTFKLLVDDTTWQTGPDVAGTPGASHTVTPSF